MTLTVIHRPSPNFNARKGPITTLMLHYTGMESGEAAIERLCDPEAGVSAHYVVNEDGSVLQLVAETRRAWHAGVGQWRGQSDMNSASIGIEIVNGGHDFGLPDYSEAQIAAVIALCQDIVARHEISPTDVIGHSDMAPDRKTDPGEHFAWARLAAAGIGLWPDGAAHGEGELDVGQALTAIGYGVGDYALNDCVAAFQRRFRPSRVDGVADAETLRRIAQVFTAYSADA